MSLTGGAHPGRRGSGKPRPKGPSGADPAAHWYILNVICTGVAGANLPADYLSADCCCVTPGRAAVSWSRQ